MALGARNEDVKFGAEQEATPLSIWRVCLPGDLPTLSERGKRMKHEISDMGGETHSEMLQPRLTKRGGLPGRTGGEVNLLG